jgi:propanol-preferring alcohol dehydrogenase
MKAQVLVEQKSVDETPLEFRECPRPEPLLKEILVKVTTCAVCRTDQQIIEGDLPLKKNKLIPGHQITGVVASMGKEAKGFSLGDRIGIPWLYSTCQECSFCNSGLENLCKGAKFTGYDVDGGYGEYVVCNCDYAIHLPSTISDKKVAPLLCGGIVGYRSFKLANPKKGERLGLFGFGGSAYITLQIAVHMGCIVSVFTRSAEHQKKALQLGASYAGPIERKPEKPLDSAIIFAPSGEIIPVALDYLKRGGALIVNAIHTTPIPKMDYSTIYFEKTLKTVANATRKDGAEFLKLAQEIQVETEVTEYPLKDALLAHRDLKRSKFSGSALLIA